MSNLEDVLKSVVLGGVGAVATVLDKGAEIGKTLVEKGQQTVDSNQETIDSLKQKFRDARIVLKENELQIHVTTQEDLTLEKVTLKEKAPFFSDVFHVQPRIRQKKAM